MYHQISLKTQGTEKSQLFSMRNQDFPNVSLIQQIQTSLQGYRK